MYEWQMWVSDFGERGQRILKKSSVLVSRCGGVGGAAALYLAAAGIGRLVLAHAGHLKISDVHRQILMSHGAIGTSRVRCAAARLRELNPRVQVDAVEENITDENAAKLVGPVDLIVDAAPLFAERFAMNRQAVAQRKPMIESAMYDLEAQLTTIIPGQTPCLACLYPADPPAWKRQFPVFGAVAGMIGALAAMEAIKVLCGFGDTLAGRLLMCNLREMSFRTMKIERNPGCAVCGASDPKRSARSGGSGRPIRDR